MANIFKVEKFSIIKVTGLHSMPAKVAFKDILKDLEVHDEHFYVEAGPDQFILTEQVAYIQEEE